MPVIGDGIDDIVGIVYFKDLIRHERARPADGPVTEVSTPPHFVPEDEERW